MATHRLLIIEDDYDVAEMLLAYFQMQHYEVMHADNGEDGIEIARTKFPNIILLDVMLPDMDGYDVCYRLRHMALTKYIPTLFLTQKDERASKVKGLELGADDYITKPFDIDELRLRVDGALYRATRENLHEARTGLPTGPLVAEEIQRRQSHGAEVIHLMIQGFEAYADVYSFMAANDVMYQAGKAIRDVLATQGTRNDFAGIVNDAFVVATHADAQTITTAIKAQFNTLARTFYTFADAARGGLLVNEGDHNERFVPMMTFVTAQEVADDN